MDPGEASSEEIQLQEATLWLKALRPSSSPQNRILRFWGPNGSHSRVGGPLNQGGRDDSNRPVHQVLPALADYRHSRDSLRIRL